MAVAIKLVENLRARAICERTPHYDVMLFGVKFEKLHFNMTGYVGYLPYPPEEDGVGFWNPGEKGLSTYKKDVAWLNKKWKAFMALNPSWVPTVENKGIDPLKTASK